MSAFILCTAACAVARVQCEAAWLEICNSVSCSLSRDSISQRLELDLMASSSFPLLSCCQRLSLVTCDRRVFRQAGKWNKPIVVAVQSGPATHANVFWWASISQSPAAQAFPCHSRFVQVSRKGHANLLCFCGGFPEGLGLLV